MADMIKFFKGLEAGLPAVGVNGALYITTDEGAIYLGTGSGMKRLGDFIQVANVASLPEKAHESCLYYCVAENILAKWNGTEWKQINKQPTAEEMKTLLGLGSMAYKSEVAEGDLNAALKEKVNAAAEGNHAHSNKDVLDGITAEKVSAWDAAEQNAKDHATGLNTAMNTRVEALEAIDHSHTNKELLDTYTQTEANLADAVAKKHEHENKTELDKIVAGDVAKWNGVVADHLTSTDKTALEDAIGDVNTALGEEVTRAKAAEQANTDAISGIKNGTSINSFAGVETELAKKVEKVEGKDLIATSEIERLATLANYDDTQVKADIAKKADAETMTTELGKKVDKVEGKDLIATSEIERLATLKNYDDTALAGRVTTAEGKITALETESAKHALKTELDAVDAKFANYKTAEAQKAIDDEQDRRLGVIEGDYLKAADIANFETKANVQKVADDLAAYVESNDEALAGVKATAEAARTEDEVNAQIDAKITALNLATTYEPIGAETRAKAYADGLITEANLAQYTTEEEVKSIVDGVIAGAADSETYNSLTKLVDYIDAHGGEAAEMAQAIETLEGDVKGLKEAPSAGIKASDIEAWNGEIGAKALAETKTTTAEVKDQIEAYGYATADALATEKSEREAADAELAAAIEAAKTDASNKDAVVLAEAQKYADQAEADAIAAAEGKVNALAGNVYTKEQTFTKDEVNAAIAAAMSWGEF